MLETVPTVSVHDETNRRILAVSEDQLSGFHADPFGEIAQRSGVPVDDVIERVRAMLVAGSIRRVRQTLLSTRLAASALVAWKLPPERLDAAFDYMYAEDPFSGHVVLRSTDRECPGGDFRLWTTLKVPQGFSLHEHCELLARRAGAEAFRVMPARCLFVLGVGHTRRRDMAPGARSDTPPDIKETTVLRLSDAQWRVLAALKRPFDLANVHTVPPDLDFLICAAEHNQFALACQPRDITCSVHATAIRRKRICDKSLSRHGRIVEVASRQLHAGDVHITNCT